MKQLYRYEQAYIKIYKAFIFGDYPKHIDTRTKIYPKLSEANKTLFIDFFDLLKSEGLSMGRRLKYLNHLPNLALWHKEDYSNATIESLIKLAGVINEQKYTLATKKDYLNAVKKIFKTITQLPKYKALEPIYFWLYDKRTKFYSTTLNYTKQKVREDFLTEEEVNKILENTENLRDRAFFSLLASQGTRPQEILTLRKKDITQLENGLQVVISGKTGIRTLFIYEKYTTQDMNRYLKTLSKDEEYVFNLTPRTAINILRRICKKVGIEKRINLYKFRKFAVTQDRIHNVSTHSLEKKFGWVVGTKVIRHYDKSTPIDYMNEMQRKNGIIETEKPKTLFEDKKCLRCGEKNPYDSEYCFKCNLKLSMTKEEMMQGLTTKDKEIQELKELVKKNEERLEFIYNKLVLKVS